MSPIFRVAAIQFEPRWGAKEVNLDRLLSPCQEAVGRGCVLLVRPEMATAGYIPPASALYRLMRLLHQEVPTAVHTPKYLEYPCTANEIP